MTNEKKEDLGVVKDKLETVDEKLEELEKMSFKFSVFIGLLVIFLMLVGTSFSQSNTATKEARKALDASSKQSTRQAVTDEKLDWLREATERIETKLDKLKETK